MTNQGDKFQQNIIIAALQDDDELKQRVRRLAYKVIAQSERLIDHGSPSVQQMVIKSVMPAITAALKAEAEDERFEHMRMNFEEMIQSALGVKVEHDLDED